jgi:hypothetical protein
MSLPVESVQPSSAPRDFTVDSTIAISALGDGSLPFISGTLAEVSLTHCESPAASG